MDASYGTRLMGEQLPIAELMKGDPEHLLARLEKLLATSSPGQSCGDDAALAERISSNQHASATTSSSPHAAGKHMLLDLLKGKHQQLFRQLLGRDNPALVRRYLRLMPAEPRLYSSLMRECRLRRRADLLQIVIEVGRQAHPLSPHTRCLDA